MPEPTQADPTTQADAGEQTGDEQTINVHDLLVSLDPDISGKLEGLSGILLVNMPQAEYMAAFLRFGAGQPLPEDLDLIRTINHETYHALQAACSGYFFDQQRLLWAVLNQYQPPAIAPSSEVTSLLAQMRTEAGDDPHLKARAAQAAAAIVGGAAIDFFNQNAAPADNSLFGALHPAFFRAIDAASAHTAEHNQQGLSILGVLEGSAVAFAHQVLKPHGGAEAAMQEELATLPPEYNELYNLTRAHVGPRALELILPATALALCYTEPHNAYLPLLGLLAASPAGGALALGRTLAAKLPEIPAAGAILGSAADLRKSDDSYRIYDDFIGAVEQPRWPVGMYDLLADPAAINHIDSMPFALVTLDGFQGIKGSMTENQLYMRIYLMSLVMRKISRRPEEDEIRDAQGQWAHDVIARLADSLSDASSPDTPAPATSV